MKVTRVAPEELETLRKLSDEGHAAWAGAVYDWPNQKRGWLRLYETGRFDLLALHDGREPQGVLAVVFCDDPRDGSPVAMVMAWYARPSARPHGLRLYREMIERAKRRGCKRVRMGFSSCDATERLRTLCERLGFFRSEVVMDKEVA